MRTQWIRYSSSWLFAMSMVPMTMPKVDCNIHKAEFVPAESGLMDLKLPLQILAASPMIYIEGPGTRARCSSSIVSDRGHILTAGHCVESCLRQQGAYKTKKGVSMVDDTALRAARCTLMVDGVYMEAEVLAVNDCPPPEWLADGAPLENCSGLDYAILQIKGDVLAKRPCLQVSDRLPKAGQSVLSVGHPLASKRTSSRKSARDSDGQSKYISVGKTLAPQEHCQLNVDTPGVMQGLFGDKSIPGPRSISTPDGSKLILKQVQSGELIQTTADILKGSSGGPLVGRYTGKVVGVASFYTGGAQGESAECAGAAFFASTASVKKQIEHRFPGVAEESFSCQKYSFIR